MTTKNDFLNFARVCIEINASFPFPPSIRVAVETLENIFVPVDVEY